MFLDSLIVQLESNLIIFFIPTTQAVPLTRSKNERLKNIEISHFPIFSDWHQGLEEEI